jgi:hypothetical protein
MQIAPRFELMVRPPGKDQFVPLNLTTPGSVIGVIGQNVNSFIDEILNALRLSISARFTQPIGGGAPVPDIKTWLYAQQQICAALLWEDATGVKAFNAWPSNRQEDLVQAFTRAWTGQKSTAIDPPPNLVTLADNAPIDTVIPAESAWALFRDLVAWSLAVELSGQLSWSITTYTPAELYSLFDSETTFRWNAQYGGYRFIIAHGAVIPAPPDVALAFLAQNGIISYSALNSVEWLVDWCHHNLSHFLGGTKTIDYQDQWQYRGFPPLTRVIGGTLSTQNDGVKHRTAGCHGTAGLFHSLLRVINIPAFKVQQQGTELSTGATANHATVSFPSIDKWLTHGDDPYSRGWPSVNPETSSSALLISTKQYAAWFGQNLDEELREHGVGRQPIELALKNLSNFLLEEYCADQKSGATHANGKVAQFFSGLYTVAQLEAMNVWGKMDAKIAALGGCANVPKI